MVKITIYGLPGTGKGEVSKLLAKKLNYEHLSAGDMMRKNATDLGITLAELKEKRMTDPIFDHKLDEFSAEFGRSHDDFIFESRLPWYFIPDSFKIKLTGDLEVRMKRVASRDGISLEEANDIESRREKTDGELYKDLYGIEDTNADEHFDFNAVKILV